MSKNIRKISVAVITVSIAATTAFGTIKASGIYDDSNIGLSAALERYAESTQADTTEATEASSETSTEAAVAAVEAAETTEAASTEAASTEAAAAETTEASTEAAAAAGVTETCMYPQFKDRCLTTVSNEVNIRATASADGELVGTLGANGIAIVKEKGDTWTKIASGSCVGYVKNEYLVYGDEAGLYAEKHCDKVATVTTETLKVREDVDAESECLTMIPGGETYEVLEETDNWTKVQVDEDTKGYVSSDYVDITFETVKAVSVEEAEAAKAAEEAAAEAQRQAEEAAAQQQQQNSSNSSSSNSSSSNSSSSNSSSSSSSSSSKKSKKKVAAASGSTGTDLVNYALQFVGNPYVYGGSSLTNGTDCSGFTMSVYAQYGISLPHHAASQASYGTEVDFDDLQPGDLIFYGSKGSISHVAIYTGGGMVVHASSKKTGIKTSVYNYRTPVKAVRLLGQ